MVKLFSSHFIRDTVDPGKATNNADKGFTCKFLRKNI